MKKDKKGKLYGIGVGPGDPDLITVKAIKILKRVDIIYSASSSKNKHSLAFDIVSKHIPPDTPSVFLSFPMTLNKDEAKKYWLSHAQKILDDLSKGKNVAFLTLGDPLTYSTFGYLMKSLYQLNPDVDIEVIPGITSYQAAAATTRTVLAEGEESLTIISGVRGGDHLRRLSKMSENIVFLKAYKNIKDILESLKETKRANSSIAVVRCGFKDEKIIKNIDELKEKKPIYWTLIISKKGN
jgi:precorrin-2/cobalt-factor-2 C20-methyltransferase